LTSVFAVGISADLDKVEVNGSNPLGLPQEFHYLPFYSRLTSFLYSQIVKNPKVDVSSVRDPALETIFISATVLFGSSTNLRGHVYYSELTIAICGTSEISTSMRKENEIIARWDIRMWNGSKY